MQCGRALLAKARILSRASDWTHFIDLTAQAEVNGIKFDGIDIFHVPPHTNIDCDDDEIKRLAERVQRKNLDDWIHRGPCLASCWRRLCHGLASR